MAEKEPKPQDQQQSSQQQHQPQEQLTPGAIWEQIKGVRPSHLYFFFRMPCNRDAFMYGIMSGAAVGTVSFIFKRPMLSVVHGTFLTFFPVTLGYLMYCQREMRERNEAIVKGVVLQLEHQRRRLEQENSNNSNSKTE